MKSRTPKKVRPVLILILNLVIVAAVILLFVSYMQQYNQKLYDQNLRDISNVNQASAQIASELSASHERKLNNILRYAFRHPLALPEFMEYVDSCNADPDATFQLIRQDYSGYVLSRDASGVFPDVSYASNDYQKMQQIVDVSSDHTKDIPFTVEFTDYHTGSRCFGRYSCVTVLEDGVATDFTLLLVFKSSDFTRHISLNGGFAGMSTVLINADGSYALRNSDFKSDSLFHYLYAYNDLTLEQLEEIKGRVLSNDGGSFHYQNSVGEECAFVYSPVPNTDWYCVSSVPIASFHSTSPDFRFTGLLVLLLAILMVIDLIYLYQLNRRLKQSAHEANAASVAKTNFLSRMSHDIRTPINVISGMTDLALMEPNTERTVDYLKNIRASGKFLLGLVNDILDMNKVESGSMELHLKPYRYQEFITYLNAVIKPLCEEKGVEFIVQSNETDHVLLVDPLRFNQVLFNLLSNAAKFTPKGGHVKLIVQTALLPDGSISLDITVSDDGVGMSEVFQKTMFKPFTQEERTLAQNGVSTGLGLAIVKRLLDLMGGTIRVESAVGRGTTFFIHLEADVAQETVQADEQTIVASDLSGRRILLCEDHPLNTKIIVQMLAHRSVSVETAENGKVGVDMFLSAPAHHYDAVLMDVRMPVMNGLEAAEAIRSHAERDDAKTIPILALTANAYDSDVEKCLQAGMNAHLAKPVDTDRLCDTLAELIAASEQAAKADADG